MNPPQRDVRPPRMALGSWNQAFEDKVKRGGQNGSGGDFFDEPGITAAEFSWTMAAISSTSSLLLALATDPVGAGAAGTLARMVVITITLGLYSRYKAWKQARCR